MEKTPVRAIITGIDGAGKSTAATAVVGELGKTHLVLKPGPSRPTYAVHRGEKQYYFRREIGYIDALHKRADDTGKPELVGASNALNVLFSARVIEPSLSRRLRPDIILGARDYYVDPAVYSVIYQRKLGERPIQERIFRLRELCQVPFRGVIFYLDVAVETALERIQSRIDAEKLAAGVTDRKKWQHMHENEGGLTRLRNEYEAVIPVVQDLSGADVIRIDTNNRNGRQVQEIITARLRRYADNDLQPSGKIDII